MHIEDSCRHRRSEKPLWDGTSFVEKTVFVYCEYGIGDVIQIARYLPILAGCGGKVVVEVPAALVRLFNANGFAVDFICPGSSLPPHDFQISLLEVPALLNEIPDPLAGRDSYLTAPPELVAKWVRRLRALV